MPNDFTISRRALLAGIGGAGATALTAGLPASSAFAANAVVGFIYVGPRDDFGYNQAHAEGAAAVKKMKGVKVVEEERIPETVQVSKTMESMINLDGAGLLFPTSFGYFNPYILEEAKKYPKVRFEHAGGLWTPKDPKNAGSYFGYIFEAQYINGIVAGYTSKTGKLGFVAAKPIAQVLQNINAFTLGAQSVNPKATTQVIFTGDWSLPVKEAEATNSMIDQGVDVVTMHVDSPKVVVQTAAKRGAMVCGYHCSQAALAPEAYLTGAEWNWTDLYPKFVTMWMKGEAIPNFYRGGFKEGLIKQSPYGPKVSAEARKHADAVKAKLMKGEFVIFKGPISDNAGKVVVAKGAELTQGNETDAQLESMHFLVAGVKGSLPS
ncbi:MAG TPA: BMP family ABC transporter substrate-binding protein [Pseudolabrys sp.]|jgi:simple sugar transport system substrate-binding protein|nr:BMP family ABC transporter substrate-binding protein [Pseudolabrys sp.]